MQDLMELNCIAQMAFYWTSFLGIQPIKEMIITEDLLKIGVDTH